MTPLEEYNAEVAQLAGLPASEVIDPHIEEQIARAEANPDADVDPVGPTDEELERGNEVDPVNQDEDPQLAEVEGEPAAAETVTTDPLDTAVAKLREINPSLSLRDALTLAEQALGSNAATNEPQEPETPLPTVQELRQQLRDTQREWRSKIKEYADEAEIAELEKKIDALEDAIPESESYHARKAQEVNTQFARYAEQAVALYPDAEVAGSPLYARMEQIHADLEATGNPLVNAPDKALKIAQMAANELNIAPRSRSAQPTQAKPAARSTAPMTAPLAKPSARTIAPRQPSVITEIESAKTPDQFEALMRKLTRG